MIFGVGRWGGEGEETEEGRRGGRMGGCMGGREYWRRMGGWEVGGHGEIEILRYLIY